MFMINAIGDATAKLLDRPRRVWLANATTGDSVSDALTRNLFQGGCEIQPVSAVQNSAGWQQNIIHVFDTYAVASETSPKRYWNEQSFHTFLKSRFPLEALEASIPVLWKHLHFHAYFPFPRQSCQRIDCEGFQRAIALLASDGSERLGYSSLGIEIDPDRDGALNNRWRLFRSLASPSPAELSSTKPTSGNDMSHWSQIDDLLDVLDLVQPSRSPYGPTWREEFRPHASRILLDLEPYAYSSIPRKDLLNLLILLMSIQLDVSNHSATWNATRLPKNLPEEAPIEMALAILRRFVSDEDYNVGWHTFNYMMSNYLTHLPSAISSILSSILSETSTTKSFSLIERPETILSRPLIQYLSLLNPPYLQHKPAFHFNIQRALQKPDLKPSFSASSSALSATSFASALATIRNSSILLLAGISDSTNPSHSVQSGSIISSETPTVVFAVFMPFSWANAGGQVPLIGASHSLIQVRPILQILRPICPWSLSTDMHNIEDINASSEERVLRFGNQDASGLVVDFQNGTAVLKNAVVGPSAENGNSIAEVAADNGYHDVEEDAKNDGWETRMRILSLELYALDITEPPLAEETDQKGQDRLRETEKGRRLKSTLQLLER